MYADAVSRITESIFPIFLARLDGEAVTMGVSGTGFFVDDSGLFVTADHIVTNAPAGSTMYYYGKVPDQVCQPAVEIERIASDPARDLYLGRVARDYLQPIELSNEAVRTGDSVCISGYPMAVLATNSRGGFVGNVRRYWQPTFVIDTSHAAINNSPRDAYIVEHACLRGMTGGPVFDMEGKVRGMAVANHTRTIPEPEREPIVISNGIVIDAAIIQRFIDNSLGELDHTWPLSKFV
jgi:S1-C subfamily serine protease